jgi:hypothetical protein
MPSAFFDPDEFEVLAAPPKQPVAAPISNEPVLTSQSEKPKFFELKPVSSSPAVQAEPPAAQAQPIAEPIRMPEPLSLPTDFPQFAAPEGLNVDLSDLGIGSDEPKTRRQLRELQRLTGSDIVNDTVLQETSIESEFELEQDLSEQLESAVGDTSPTSFEVSAATADDFSYLANQAEPMFDVSPGLVVEPTTNSIIIDQVQDLTNYTATVSETGEILTTGAIQLPLEFTDNSTGDIQIIQEAAALDTAIQVDNSTGFINTVAPMRVTGVVNAISKFKVIPTNLKRGNSHPFVVLAAALGMAALGAVVVVALMLQII